MAQAEPSNVTALSCRGEDGGGPLREASVAGDQCVTALASSSCSQSEYVTAGMSELQIMAAIEKSKEQGWSELAEGGQDAAAGSSHGDNILIWDHLKIIDSEIFKDRYDLQLGRLVAEGGQAQIYEASFKNDCRKFAAKVFKMEGFSLADLKRQWPLVSKDPIATFDCDVDYFPSGRVAFHDYMVNCNWIEAGTFLKDGRFALVMPRYWGDLRTLINLKLRDNNSQGPPFLHPQALKTVLQIVRGMEELHNRGVLHRDLKATNALLQVPYDTQRMMNATLILGVMIQGHITFYGYFQSDWKRVIDGERPHLLDYIDPSFKELPKRCCHKEPSKRPTFEVIVPELKKMIFELEKVEGMKKIFELEKVKGILRRLPWKFLKKPTTS